MSLYWDLYGLDKQEWWDCMAKSTNSLQYVPKSLPKGASSFGLYVSNHSECAERTNEEILFPKSDVVTVWQNGEKGSIFIPIITLFYNQDEQDPPCWNWFWKSEDSNGDFPDQREESWNISVSECGRSQWKQSAPVSYCCCYRAHYLEPRSSLIMKTVWPVLRPCFSYVSRDISSS